MNLYQKINEVKKSIKGFSKDASTTGYGSYKYTSGSQILGLIKEKMEELQILFMPIETEHRNWETYNYKTSTGKEMTDFIVDGIITYAWINAEKPEERELVKFQYYGQQNDISKAFGSGLTYTERYLLLKSLGIPTDEDDPDKKTEQKPISKPNLITKVQIEEMKTLQVNVDGVLKYYKINKLEDLTKAQADFVINKKRKELEKEFKEQETKDGKTFKEIDINKQNEKLEEIK